MKKNKNKIENKIIVEDKNENKKNKSNTTNLNEKTIKKISEENMDEFKKSKLRSDLTNLISIYNKILDKQNYHKKS